MFNLHIVKFQSINLCVSEQVGTLDVLVGLSDDLAKLDAFVERFDFYLEEQKHVCFSPPCDKLLFFYSLSVVKKIAHYMADVLEDSRDKVMENLLASGGKA